MIPQTGIERIDLEHAGLLDCLNRLELFVEKGHGFAASIDTLLALQSYAKDHFAHEETFLAEKQFPHLKEHIAQHEAISAHVAELYTRVLAGEEIESSIVDTIRQWLLKHIGVEDMEFACYYGTAVRGAIDV